MTDKKKGSISGGKTDKSTTIELEELKQEIAKIKDLAARAQADLQNAKDRLQKEAAEMRSFALQQAILTLLPTIDNFQRAVEHLPKELADHDWAKGIVATEQELLKQLEKMGLKKINVLGQSFDSTKHEVLQVGFGAEGKVLEVFENGFELNGKILRPAKVKVGDGFTEVV